MTQAQYETATTPAQRDAMIEVFTRRKLEMKWPAFLASANLDALMGCIMVPWCGMWLGIEPDGWTHG